MLHVMRINPDPNKITLTRALELLGSKLPGGWLVVRSPREPRGAQYLPDALFEVHGPDGSMSTIVVEARGKVTASQAADFSRRLPQAVMENRAAGSLVVTSYIGRLARERLNAADIWYLDLTGNALIALDRPALFIDSQGANRAPRPVDVVPQSLESATAARITRALCDRKPPLGVRELSRRAHANSGYTSLLLEFLETENVVTRDAQGVVMNVNWPDLLVRWSLDYEVAKTNRAVMYHEPLGAHALVEKLRGYNKPWALTGSMALPAGVASTPSRTVSCYLDNPERVARDLQLSSGDSGANVILLEPFDEVIWERTRTEGYLNFVAVSQCAVDLLTGEGREPCEGRALLEWMARNEDAWRA